LPSKFQTNPTQGENMPVVTTADGTQLFYKDWGTGQPIVFSHGWPLSSDAWDTQMLFFGSRGYRVVAHDRRGHGRSTQTWNGNNMDTFADDLGAVMEALDLKDVILVGHSIGAGEVARYIGRHGISRISKLVLIGTVTPILLKSDSNSEGVPQTFFDGVREGVAGNKPQFFKDLSVPYFGFNRPQAKISEGLRERYFLQAMLGGIKSIYDSIEAFSVTDFTDDLKAIAVPTLILHGEGDQIAPVGLTAEKTVRMVEQATLKTYPGLSHGMTETHPDKINADLLAFFKD
jgi:non-heme chloroperoxidase